MERPVFSARARFCRGTLQIGHGTIPARKLLNRHAFPRMNGTTSPALPAVAQTSRGTNWFPVAIFALVWIELISRLRFEWSINPQYGYGWTVPLLSAYIFWRRYESAPAPSPPHIRIL